MSGCPEVDVWIDGLPGKGSDHEASCAACRSLSSLCRVRRVASEAPRADEQCARFEPYVGAMIDGTMQASEVPGLCEHLAQCASCSDIAASLTMLQAQWGDVPDPRLVLRGRERNLAPRTQPARGLGRAASARLRAGLQVGLLVGGALALGVWLGHRASTRTAVVVASAPSSSAAGSAPSQPPPESASVAVLPAAPSQEPASSSRPPPLAASGKGYVSIQCQPSCESVLIDGVNAGPSPVIRREVAAGERRITLHRGTVSRDRVLKVKAGETIRLSVKMDEEAAAESGYLTVVCSPFCDEVLVDGRSVGPSPVVHVPVPAGVHTVTLKRSGVVKTLSATIRSGEVTSWRVSMAP
ncbi:MAG: PEGA domain-containing protein [Deltaproteobacteria bacterium]|nr:PEGA domain-containing protein [Deltaproteobacteria bacterium]